MKESLFAMADEGLQIINDYTLFHDITILNLNIRKVLASAVTQPLKKRRKKYFPLTKLNLTKCLNYSWRNNNQ